MSANEFAVRLSSLERDLLESQFETGRNPHSTWDGGHFALPNTDRPLSVSRIEARFLANLVALVDAHVVLEIGAGFGYSSTWLAYGLSSCSNAASVYTVDDQSEGSLGGRGFEVAETLWSGTGLRDLVNPVYGTSPGILDNMPPLQAEVVFIDGEHRRGQPLLDYRAAVRHLAPTGLIVFHDAQQKYEVNEAVSTAEADGFHLVPLQTSSEAVAATRDSVALSLVPVALSLSRRRLLIGTDGWN